ncbi:conserved Plasmodium protein, unknown function [Plasmodium sp. gorilla clade G2]|uniref:conserved Plasmodium protein, unknown function n=1 Tax=Plasmodium sp. gorilla clade G2 TaxID=880535 RepID=UPI000D224ED5|nr:conserved Plasmodium protein, unknown function [Plasmodium sp. gorilla clade G2]SOV13700.1 conserved Plasmodium protein, unknown function [Plasmodium sp. gorilla clade G2]
MKIIKYIFFAFFILVLFVCALNSYIYLKQDSFIFSNEFPTVEEKNQILGENYEIVTLTTKDNHKFTCWYIKTKDSENKPIMLYFQGNGGYLEKYMNLFNLIIDRVDVNIFSCSNRGCGSNIAKPSEEYLYKDASVYIEYVKTKNPKHLFIFGSSMGAAVAIDTALKQNDNISGLIVQNAFTSLKNLSKYSHPFLHFFLFDYDMIIRSKMDNESKIKNITVPTLFTLSEMDEKVPTTHTRTLFQLCASTKKQLYLSKGGTHPDILKNDDGSYHKTMKKFIEDAIAIREKNIQDVKEKNPNKPT